jgi:hypothetical protein
MTVQDLKELCDEAIKDGATDLVDLYISKGSWETSVHSMDLVYKTEKDGIHSTNGQIPFTSSFIDLADEEIEHIEFVRKNCGSPLP